MQRVKWLEGRWNGRVYWILDHASTETSGGTMRVPELEVIGKGRVDGIGTDTHNRGREIGGWN